ncbi:MAG: hypothetical protein ABSC46_13675 [Candidatus Limnocylindrales bacterium]
MARQQSRYICQACGAAHLRWEGQCRTCGEWNTLVETVVRAPDSRLDPLRLIQVDPLHERDPNPQMPWRRPPVRPS